ncbi:MAG: M1 family aminopeptidase [Bacteroidota bacterium]
MLQKPAYLLASIIIALVLLNPTSKMQCATEYTDYKQFIQEFENLKLDGKSAEVKDCFITKDVGNFSLESGRLFFCKPLAGRICVVIFIGDGSFDFTPPDKVEQNQLLRYYNTSNFNRKIKSAFMVFGDSSAYDLIKEFNPKEDIPSTEAEDNLNAAKKSILSKEKDDMDDFIVRTLINSDITQMFYSQIVLNDNKTVFFHIDPNDPEEIKFSQENWYAVIGSYAQNICSFHRQDYNPQVDSVGKNDEISIEKNIMHVNLDSKLDFSCKTQLIISPKKENLKWIPLSIASFMEIDSVSFNSNDKVNWFKPEKSSTLWVKFPSNIKIRDTLKLNISYHGDLIVDVFNYHDLKTSIGWYVNYGYKEKTFFDISFNYPADFKLLSIGEKLSQTTNDNICKSHWVTSYKTRNASFTIGHYSSKEYQKGESVPVELLYNSEFDDYRDNVLEDVALSFEFYTKLFGPIRPKRMNISVIPSYHGEAFPGFINLSFSTFQSGNNQGFHEQFCSHEVAHQWWAISVDFESYRDQWLSEGFAEYSSLMYWQMVSKDNEKFFKFLKRFKETVMNIRNSFLSSGVEAGPIALGYRNRTVDTPRDYDLIVYQKGAWVLHMLRNMMLDFKTMNDNLFISLLKEFHETFKGKSATTDDFRILAEKKCGFDLTWFFDEWVNSNKVPEYTFAYKYEKTIEGKYKVHCRVKQSEVPPDFKMIVPLKIDFGDDKFTRVKALITGKVMEFDLPLMPLEPKKIIFNDLESVLCDVNTESWD